MKVTERKGEKSRVIQHALYDIRAGTTLLFAPGITTGHTKRCITPNGELKFLPKHLLIFRALIKKKKNSFRGCSFHPKVKKRTNKKKTSLVPKTKIILPNAAK